MPIKFPHRDSLMEDLLKLEFVHDKNKVYNVNIESSNKKGDEDKCYNVTINQYSPKEELLYNNNSSSTTGNRSDYLITHTELGKNDQVDNINLKEANDNISSFCPSGGQRANGTLTKCSRGSNKASDNVTSFKKEIAKENQADNISLTKDSKQ